MLEWVKDLVCIYINNKLLMLLTCYLVLTPLLVQEEYVV